MVYDDCLGNRERERENFQGLLGLRVHFRTTHVLKDNRRLTFEPEVVLTETAYT